MKDLVENSMGMILLLRVLRTIEDSGASQAEALAALEAAKALIPSLPISLVNDSAAPESS